MNLLRFPRLHRFITFVPYSRRMDARPSLDPCPPSAVSHGVGIVGMAGLALWTWLAWRYGMDGPHAGMAAVLACGVPMLLWSLLVDKVHRRPSTGIDWASPPRPLKETLDVSIVKLAGLWATWGGIALFYGLARWYADGGYIYAMKLFTWAAPVLLVGSVPYVLWIDRRLREPRDDCFAFGQWVIGGAAGKPEPGVIADHLRGWAVKAFFLAFMLSIVPANFANVVHWHPSDIIAGPVNLANFLVAALFLVDVAFATIGYMLTLRPLDAHIRRANPLMGAWMAALICYPPFVLMGPGGPLDYHSGSGDWSGWMAGHGWLLWLWGSLLVALTAIYAWATVAFGIRFSNLTHRGIITHGPYRWTRHPAYLAKNLFWWCSVLPFLPTSGNWTDAVRNCALLGLTSAVYYWRAKTEEAHLSDDPDYRAYSDWVARNGLLRRSLLRASPATPPASIPAA